MNRFEFQFRLSEDQFRQAHRAYLRHSLLTVKNLFMVTIALMIGLVQTQLFGGVHWGVWFFGGLWLLVVGLVVFVYIWMPGRIYRVRPGISADQKVIVDDDGLDWTVGERHRLVSWSEIERASDIHPDFVFFHPRHGLPDILPKRVFRSEDELVAFDRFVQSKLHG